MSSKNDDENDYFSHNIAKRWYLVLFFNTEHDLHAL